MFNSTSDLIDKLNVAKAIYSKFDEEAETTLSKTLIQEALEDVYKQGNRIIGVFIIFHFLLGIFFAIGSNTWLETILLGFVTIGLFYFLTYKYPRKFFTRALAGIILQSFVLLYIYQMSNDEVRLFFFTSFIIMIIYQDWVAMWPSALLFIGQMLAFIFLGEYIDSLPFVTSDYKKLILDFVPTEVSEGSNQPRIHYYRLAIYIGVSGLQISLAGLWAGYLRRQTIREVLSKQSLLTKQIEIQESNEKLEENVHKKTRELQESLEMTQANEEELRQNMEELQATQDEMENQRLRLLANQETMQQVEKELRERQAKMERSQWLESNLSRFDEIMRLNYDKNLEEFSDIIMLHLAELISATQGAFYVLEDNLHTLKMQGGYACTPNSVKKAEFKAGEGILGQIVKTRKMIHLTDLPDDSAVIESALTKVRSKSLVIFPLLYNQDIQGVIEIATLESMDELHLEFLNRLSENIASMLQSIRGIRHTQKLLAQSQEMTSKLQENAKELEKTKQEVEQRALAFQTQFKAINRSMLVMEYSIGGDIISANDNFLALSKYSSQELVDKHQSIFLAENYVNSEEYKQLWNKIRNNDNVESEYECIAKDGSSFWMKANYYSLGTGKDCRIMILGYDTTVEKEQDKKILEQLDVLKEKEEILRQNLDVMKELQEEVENKAAEAKEQINAVNISTAMIEYDGNGYIKYINDKFLEITGYHRDELTGRSHKVLVKRRFAESKSYQRFWERLQAMEFIDGEFEIVAKNGEMIWLRGSYYPVADKKGKLVKVMQLASNITHEMKQEETIKDYLMNLEIAQANLKEKTSELKAQLNAIDRSTGMIEMDSEGKILRINDKFLELTQYDQGELVGKHHKVLVAKEFAQSKEYKDMWEKLNKNQFVEGEFSKVTKEQTIILVRSSYYPVLNSANQVTKIIGIVSAPLGNIARPQEKVKSE